jgi:hypothetical protein
MSTVIDACPQPSPALSSTEPQSKQRRPRPIQLQPSRERGRYRSSPSKSQASPISLSRLPGSFSRHRAIIRRVFSGINDRSGSCLNIAARMSETDSPLKSACLSAFRRTRSRRPICRRVCPQFCLKPARAPCTKLFPESLRSACATSSTYTRGSLRVPRHSHGTDRGYLADGAKNPLLDAVLRSKSICA